ncbi:MAG: hypothetical protein ACI8SE_000132 [Bacteroidia bacterium]|jgi:hypothetical protein
MKKILIGSITACLLILHSCKDDKPTPSTNNQPQKLCDSLNISYNTHIKTTIDANCNTAYCHAQGTGGFMLGTYNEVKTAAKKATFLGAIKHESGFEAMPKGGAKLSDEIIQQLECWEKTGFKENQ